MIVKSVPTIGVCGRGGGGVAITTPLLKYGNG